VDDAPGFLGMEVLVDHRDASIFHLLTLRHSREMTQVCSRRLTHQTGEKAPVRRATG
jgi:hypothetical protein